MKSFLEQIGALLGSGIAAACCLGLPVVLTAMGAAGLGFLVHDAWLFPLFVAGLGISLWLLYRSAHRHRDLKPFWLGLVGGLLGSAALWLMVTGIYPRAWLVVTGLVLVVAASIWDLLAGRSTTACANTAGSGAPKSDPKRRAMTGAAISVAAAAAFYGLYQSVEVMTPETGEDDIACWGINACKGTTACSTAFNACTGQNKCKGKGYVYSPARTCFLKGGIRLKGSPADPARG